MSHRPDIPSKPLSRVGRRALLKSKYFQMARANHLDLALAKEVEDFEAGILTGQHFDGSGLVVVGESGSGKTREIDHALLRFAAKTEPMESGLARNFRQIDLVGETTWKSLGLRLVEKLDYPMSARRTEHEIWARARMMLKAQGIWLIHIDECQHMFQSLGKNEHQTVLNSLKTLIKNRDWPTVIILSGIPELLQKINLDSQLQRLMSVVHMRRIDPRSSDIDEIDTAFVGLAGLIGVDISDVRNEDTYLRMIYACLDAYGRVFRFMVDLLSSVPEGQKKITLTYLADHYAFLTGLPPGHNVFLRDDYESCTVGLFMED